GGGTAATVDGDAPITITTGLQASAVQQFFDGDTYENNRWTRLIQDRLNINVEVTFTADISTEAYMNQMNMMLITGNVPDVIRWGDPTWLVQAQSAGLLMDITDIFEQYARPEIQAFREHFPAAFEGVTFNGRLYGIPFLNDNFHTGSYLWIRDDWLEYAGRGAPTTVNEMVELARIFANGDPNGDGSTSFGLGLHQDLVHTNAGTLIGLMAGYGVPARGTGGTFFRGADGNVTFSHIQPGVREALALVRDMYAEGLINPEFVTTDLDTLTAGISTGNYGMMYHMNWGTWHPFNTAFQSMDVIWRPYPNPVADGHQLQVGVASNISDEYFVISANAQNPVAIMEILNLYYEIAVGFEDEANFLRYWDNEQYRLAPIFLGIPTELHAPYVFQAFEDGGATISGVARQAWLFAENFANGTDTSPSAFGTWGQMHTEGLGGSMAIALNIYRPQGALIEDLMGVEIPDIWLQNSSILATMLGTTFTDIIRGTQPIEAFDTFVENWLANGGQETIDQLEIIATAAGQ
ncbi:MAG: extracellular solute-binding protein, partial [Defluviitaleaceae bacterium]|nr:extracellular solute-binding protein [Defluviitaleaceae bacterium]